MKRKKAEHVCFKNLTMGLAHSPKFIAKQAAKGVRRFRLAPQ
jgi:hypothetical protein